MSAASDTVPADVRAEFDAWLDEYDRRLRDAVDKYFGLSAEKAASEEGGPVDPKHSQPIDLPVADSNPCSSFRPLPPICGRARPARPRSRLAQSHGEC